MNAVSILSFLACGSNDIHVNLVVSHLNNWHYREKHGIVVVVNRATIVILLFHSPKKVKTQFKIMMLFLNVLYALIVMSSVWRVSRVCSVMAVGHGTTVNVSRCHLRNSDSWNSLNRIGTASSAHLTALTTRQSLTGKI